MRDAVEQVLAQLWVVLHHRYIALFTSIVICCAGWIYIEFVPDKYQAETKVYLDTQSILKSLLQGLAVDNNAREQSAAVMQRTLITRPNMRKVILETDLNLEINGPKETERMIDKLIENIRISSVSLVKQRNSSSNLYYIRYTDEDPEIAKDVIVVLLNIFVESILGASRKDSHDAEEFLDQQIQEYERRQFDAEERLKLFKQKNIGVMPAEGRSHYQDVAKLDSLLENTKLQLVETENRIVEIKRQIKLLVSSATDANTNSGKMIKSPLELRIEEKEKMLDDLLLQYTDNHPDVINLRLVLEQLYEKKNKTKASSDGSEIDNVDSSVLSLPLYQDLNVMLGEVQSEAVALRTRIKSYEQQRAEKSALLKTLSEVEAELASLNRDYTINKKMYEDLVVRRESSKLSAKAEQTGDKLQFKIIEPPRTPHLPISPDRVLLTVMVMLAALGGGIGASILLEQVKPTYYTRNQITENIEFPVLGSVSMYWTQEEKRKRRVGFIVFSLIGFALILSFGGVLYHNGIVEQLGIR